MLVEGIGKRAPAPVTIPLSRFERLVLRNAADARDRYRGYAQRADAWGRGLIKRATLVGLAGEHAFCEFLSRRGFPRFADTTLRPSGDGGQDVEVVGLVFQVKTRRKGIAQRSLVKRGDVSGRIVALACDVFVFAQWDETASGESPKLLGWIWAQDARRDGRFERSPISHADHWNLKIPDALLLPMSRLVDELVSRQ